MEQKRILFELQALQESLELTDGDSNIPQLGGYYKDVKGKIKGYQAHHMPAKSTLETDRYANNLPTIMLSVEDHKLTDSFAGKNSHRYNPIFQEQINNNREKTYKDEVRELIENGGFPEVVRCEIFNIRDKCGNKYDGAIKQYFDCVEDMILKKGVPKKRQ